MRSAPSPVFALPHEKAPRLVQSILHRVGSERCAPAPLLEGAALPSQVHKCDRCKRTTASLTCNWGKRPQTERLRRPEGSRKSLATDGSPPQAKPAAPSAHIRNECRPVKAAPDGRKPHIDDSHFGHAPGAQPQASPCIQASDRQSPSRELHNAAGLVRESAGHPALRPLRAPMLRAPPDETLLNGNDWPANVRQLRPLE